MEKSELDFYYTYDVIFASRYDVTLEWWIKSDLELCYTNNVI